MIVQHVTRRACKIINNIIIIDKDMEIWGKYFQAVGDCKLWLITAEPLNRDVKPFYKLDIKNFTLPSYESP